MHRAGLLERLPGWLSSRCERSSKKSRVLLPLRGGVFVGQPLRGK